jgi:hypothetical protein
VREIVDAFANESGQLMLLPALRGKAGSLDPAETRRHGCDLFSEIAKRCEIGIDGSGPVKGAKRIHSVAHAFEEVMKFGITDLPLLKPKGSRTQKMDC